MTIFTKNLYAMIIGMVLTAVTYIVGMKVGWITTLDWVEIWAVYTSYVCTILCNWESRTNYWWGAVSVALYSWLFYNQNLFSSAMLNVYLFPVMLWGWYRWKPDIDTRIPSWVTMKWWPVYIAFSVAVWIVLSHFSAQMGAILAGPDSFILVASILAQALLDQKKFENWIIWLAVNVFSIYTYFHAGLYLVTFQYVFFLLNDPVGLYMWFRPYMPNKGFFNAIS